VEQVGSRKELAMTDWDLMTEYIQNAMHVVDKAHAATRQLRENATPETFDNFRAQLQELTEHLTKLQTVLNNQEAFALDEMADWLSKAFTGKPSEYRRTPRMQLDTPGSSEG
jgi:Zn-dependent oligopeptidase